ncbi:MAG: thioredoxin family protein [Candidatus Aenigmatarchaeota archaeon]
MAILSEQDKKEIKKMLDGNLVNKVTILFFNGNTKECIYCKEIEELLKELESLSDKIEVKIYDINSEVAKKYDVKYAPTILFEQKPNVRYLGIPSGYEFGAFLEDIIHISKDEVHLKLSTAKIISQINKKVEIKVFVTPTCPYCPKAVHIAHQFAMLNPNIVAEMIEAIEFEDLANKYEVMAVPKIVINDKVEFEGAVPEEYFAEQVIKAL